MNCIDDEFFKPQKVKFDLSPYGYDGKHVYLQEISAQDFLKVQKQFADDDPDEETSLLQMISMLEFCMVDEHGKRFKQKVTAKNPILIRDMFDVASKLSGLVEPEKKS